MSSGCYMTGNGNSIIRSFLATCVSIILGAEPNQIFNKTMGDDCIEDRVGGSKRIETYLNFGFALQTPLSLNRNPLDSHSVLIGLICPLASAI